MMSSIPMKITHNAALEVTMHKRLSCLGVSVLLLVGTSAMAADEGTSGGRTAKAEDMAAICKDEAAKLNLSGEEADSFLAKCTAPVNEDARVGAGGAGRLEGTQ
jgi:hypothetical protein